jgi:dihydroorotase-like cyclic amidohydrolase
VMTSQHFAEAERDATILGLALTASEQTLRLHQVAGKIAYAWHVATARTLPLADALECARNAVACMSAEVGVHHIALDAINYRRSQPELYPEWQHINRAKAMALATLALGVWCGKGWRL